MTNNDIPGGIEADTVDAARAARVSRYLADQSGAAERLASFPEETRQRLHDWQADQREWFGDVILEIVAEFIASDDKRHRAAALSGDAAAIETSERLAKRMGGEFVPHIPAPSADLVERVAKAIHESWEKEQKEEADASDGVFQFEPGPWEEWIPQAHAALSALPAQSGWIVGNADGTLWRIWSSFGPVWTAQRDDATRYARRLDAEAVHAGDEDAWRVEPYAPGTEQPDARDTLIAELVGVLQSVEGAMLRGGDGAIGHFGWNITALNRARPAIRAALAKAQVRP